MFSIEGIDSSGARAGIVRTRHGQIHTPVFMPVATRATLRALDFRDLGETGTEMIISNAFLLHLRPGNEIIGQAGGLHRFMNWDRALFTDSGGFQMIRRGFLLKLSDMGLVLRSPYDGRKIDVTPEDVVEWMGVQRPDIGMVLDDLPPYGAKRERSLVSADRTMAWAGRAKRIYDELELEKDGISIFAVLQGGVDPELRKRCIRGILDLDFPGHGIGGLSIGESREEMLSTLRLTTSLLPKEKPVYLMGVGSPLELLDSIAVGVDMFDSVFPARHARHRTVLTHSGTYSVKAAVLSSDLSPLEKGCECPTCRSYSRAYIHHLVKTGEFGWMRLVTIHNLYFIQRLMKDARAAIMENRFEEFRRDFREGYVN